MRREQNWSRWRRLMVAAVLLGSALTVGSSQAETVRRVALQPNDATPAALGASSLAAAELSPGGASPSDRIGREGLYNAVSAMLITEAELVKESEGKKKAGLRGHVDKPSRASELMYAGLDDVLDEEFERAIPKLEAAIEAEPTLLSVWSTLGWTYWRVDRKDDAIALWQRLLALDEDSPVPHMLLGNGYVGTEELKKGEMHLKRSIELDPTLVEPRLVLSSVYRWTGRHRASIKLLSELLAESPDRLDIQNELALSLYHNGDYDEALPLLQQGVRAVPDNRQLVTAHARCLLHTGNVTEATLRAKRLVKDGGVDMDLLLLLADAPRYRDSPAEAVPYLEDIARNAKDPIIRREALRRLNELYVRLWEREPERYPLNKAIAAVKKLIDMDPDFIQWQQALGELYMLDRQYVPAESTFKDVISNGNTNSLNAHLGLCETYQAAKSFDRAVEQFEIASEVNPRNPYHFSMEARLEMSRAGVDEAAEAIDKLEAAGSRGAVAVLLYRGLSDSDWSDRMSVRRFRLHILALKQAGFKFLTPEELPDYFASLERPEDDLDEHRPDRAVIVTFDHVDAKTLALATEVADDFDLKFAMHVSVGRVEDGDMGVAGWDALREYSRTGHWSFGSMLYDAANLAVVAEDGLLGSSLANRIWLSEDEALEQPLAYSKRLRFEYRESRDLLREKLGPEFSANFMAYPHGDFGQGERSNVSDAIDQNLNEAAVNYEVGFIQSQFGFAVNGDNSLLYQRYAPELFDTGEDVVDHILSSHPVFLARRLRCEISALSGRLYRARHNLELLRRDGYPERPYELAEAFVYDHLAMRFGIAPHSAKAGRSELDLEISHPYAGVEYTWFRDNLDRRNWRTKGKAGLSLTQAIRLEARAGYGEFRQTGNGTSASNATPTVVSGDVKIRESFVGARVGIRHEPEDMERSPISLTAGLERHEFRGDAEFEEWLYMAELALRPTLAVDIMLQFDHDMIPSARSVAAEVAYDRYAYNAAYLLRDWWILWNNLAYFDIGDGNDRMHAGLSSLWEVSEETGFQFGIAYDYVDAKYDREDYWTPYRLNELWLVAKLRNNISELYYDITLKAGLARESVRPEEEAAYDALVISAAALDFDPGAAPKSEWVEIFSASAAIRKNIGRHWEAHWEGFYTEAPNYHEYATTAGISLIF